MYLVGCTLEVKHSFLSRNRVSNVVCFIKATEGSTRLYNVYRQHSAVLEFKDEPDVTRQINIHRKPFHTNVHLSAGLKPVHCVCLFLASNVFLTIHKTELNPLNPELNPVCYLLALLGAHHFLHVSRIRVKSLTFRRLMSYIYIYIYGAPILEVSRSHTTTQHSR